MMPRHDVLSPYFFIAKIRFIAALAYRFEVVVGILSNLLILLTSIFLWHTVYTGKQAVAGVNEGQMITYSILAALLGTLLETQVQNAIVQKVVTGEIALDFLKPVNLLLSWMSDDVGSNISMFILNLVPIVLFSLLFFTPALKLTAYSFILFMPAMLLSFFIVWIMYAVVGLMAFWFMELGNLSIVQGQVIRILSGGFIPLWFFPDWVQRISVYLPFQYIWQFPLSICIGKVSTGEIIKGIAVQFCWVACLGATLYFVWERATKRVLVQGG